MPGAILVIDQGTTSTRAIAFGPDALPVAAAQEEFPQGFPQPGWVEHDPQDLLRTSLSTARIAMARAEEAGFQVAALGIANQRETALVWDRRTGAPIHPAIVWQDRRTAGPARTLKRDGRRAAGAGARRPAARPLFLGHQGRPGCSTTSRAPGRGPSAANSPSARSTASCCGTSRAGRCTRPTPPTRPARRSTTSAAAPGTRSCAGCSACPRRCCRRCGTARPSSAPPRPATSAAPCRCAASRATSRRR